MSSLPHSPSPEQVTPEPSTNVPDREPQIGEIWQDAEGTLMVRSSGGAWWCFGTQRPVDESSEAIIQPLALMFDKFGKHVGGDLTYPEHFLALMGAQS